MIVVSILMFCSLLSKLIPTSSETIVDAKSKFARRLEFVHITKTGGSAIEKAGAAHGIIWGACHYMNITDVGCFSPDVPYTAPNYQSYAKTSPWHTPPKVLKTQYNDNENPYVGADLFAVIRNPYDRVVSEYYCPWLGFQPKFRKDTKYEKDPNDPKVMNFWVRDMVTRLEKSLGEYKATQKDGDQKLEQGKGLNEDPYNLAQKHFVNQAEYAYDGEEKVIKNVIHYENLSSEFLTLMKEYDLDVSLPPKSEGTYTNAEKKLTHLDLDEESIAVINRYAAAEFEAFGYEMVKKFEPGVAYSLNAIKKE